MFHTSTDSLRQLLQHRCTVAKKMKDANRPQKKHLSLHRRLYRSVKLVVGLERKKTKASAAYVMARRYSGVEATTWRAPWQLLRNARIDAMSRWETMIWRISRGKAWRRPRPVGEL